MSGKVTKILYKYEFYKIKDLYHDVVPKCLIKRNMSIRQVRHSSHNMCQVPY